MNLIEWEVVVKLFKPLRKQIPDRFINLFWKIIPIYSY